MPATPAAGRPLPACGWLSIVGQSVDLSMKPYGKPALVKQQKLTSITAKPISSKGKFLEGPAIGPAFFRGRKRSRFSDS